MEIGANTNVESIRTPFALNAARGAIVGVGRHEYNEYFITYAGNGAARFAPSVRYSAGSFYGGGTRYSYAFGPSIHVNEKLSGSLNVQINDITLPTISYVSTLATTRINYNFNTKVFLNAAVHNRHAPTELEHPIQHHPPAAQRLLLRLQRTSRRAQRPDAGPVAHREAHVHGGDVAGWSLVVI
jgi:hypothetical protein